MDRRESLIAGIAREIDAAHPGRCLLGVNGSGKTCFAAEFGGALRQRARHVVVISIDDFYNSRVHRFSRGELSAEGYYQDSCNFAALYSGVLDPFRNGAGSVRAKEFDLEKDGVDRQFAPVGKESGWRAGDQCGKSLAVALWKGV